MTDFRLDSTDLTWLAGLARALLREPHAADDLVQETAIAAIEGPMPAGAPRRAWLGSVARRLAARRFRGETRRARREALVARPEALPDSAELVERAEIAEQVTAAARRLPEPYRRTILLRFLEGRSSEEIAAEEGKPTDTVRWRVRKGLELLRAELVREHDRDWSSWCVLLMPLARSHGDVGLATAGASGVSWTVASLVAMKTMITVSAALGCAAVWFLLQSGGAENDDVFVNDHTASGGGVARTATELPPGSTLDDPEARVAVGVEPTVDEPDSTPPASGLFGRVIDEEGQPVAGAQVYLVSSGPTDPNAPVRGLTESNWGGRFQIEPKSWLTNDAAEPATLDLGVVANGYRRKVVPQVFDRRSSDGIEIVLERGRTLRGRVIDVSGRPVPDLELLVCTANAGVSHVSPSQRMLRGQRKVLAGASSIYDHCHATTDGRYEVTFTGLPPGTLEILPIQPGWTIEDASAVSGDDQYIVWTVKRRLGVRLLVTDATTGRPIEKAAATFNMVMTFANGEERPFGQWVGRGRGEVSFVLGDAELPGLEERTITRVVFYGTVRSGDGERVDWVADPLEDPLGVVGVAEVRVNVDPTPETLTTTDVDGEEVPPATLVLDVRYADGTPYEGELVVNWTPKADPRRDDWTKVKPTGVGRYQVEVPAGEMTLEVSERYASGSLPPWSAEVRGYPERSTMVVATLPRGATATIPRPAGWQGEWFLQASWRPAGAESWQGSLGYSSAAKSMTLPVLRPAEWRFELRQDSALAADPIVRTAILVEGETAIVE